MHRAFLFLTLLLLTSCQTLPDSRKPAYDGVPSYPTTHMDLHAGLRLRHVAGRPCGHDSNDRPQVGSDGERTYSTYELLDAAGTVLLTAPSMLSDPKYADAQFEAYYRENDELTVHASPSMRSILIVEDRSPTYPRRAYILLQRQHNNDWAWTELQMPHNARDPGPLTGATLLPGYPKVGSISDSYISFSSGKSRQLSFKEVAKGRAVKSKQPTKSPRSARRPVKALTGVSIEA